jgi:hypothetical protein
VRMRSGAPLRGLSPARTVKPRRPAAESKAFKKIAIFADRGSTLFVRAFSYFLEAL